MAAIWLRPGSLWLLKTSPSTPAVRAVKITGQDATFWDLWAILPFGRRDLHLPLNGKGEVLGRRPAHATWNVAWE